MCQDYRSSPATPERLILPKYEDVLMKCPNLCKNMWVEYTRTFHRTFPSFFSSLNRGNCLSLHLLVSFYKIHPSRSRPDLSSRNTRGRGSDNMRFFLYTPVSIYQPVCLGLCALTDTTDSPPSLESSFFFEWISVVQKTP